MTYQQTVIIETPRLQLLCCNKEIIEAVLTGDDAIAALLHISIPGKWTEFGEPAFRWTLDKLNTGWASKEWLAYLPVLKESNALAGSCGYKGNPKDGMVEIGYEIAEQFRGQGLATELVKALVEQALLSKDVTYVQAHTLAAENESGSVLKNCGMQKMEELEDPDDGKIWRWEIRK